MTFMHIHDQGLPKRALGERRSDIATAERVVDALRACGFQASAQAMAHQQVSLAVALRVLGDPGRRRGQAGAVAGTVAPHTSTSHHVGLPDFVAVPA